MAFSPEINGYNSVTYPVNMADITNLLVQNNLLTIIAAEFPYEASQLYFNRQLLIKMEGLDRPFSKIFGLGTP